MVLLRERQEEGQSDRRGCDDVSRVQSDASLNQGMWAASAAGKDKGQILP